MLIDQLTSLDQATQLTFLFRSETVRIATAGTIVEVFTLFTQKIVVPHDLVLITGTRVFVQHANICKRHDVLTRRDSDLRMSTYFLRLTDVSAILFGFERIRIAI